MGVKFNQHVTESRVVVYTTTESYSEMKLSLALLLAGLVALGVADISRCVS